MKIAISLAAAALAFAPASAFAATNIVSNGSFEFGTNPGSFSTVYEGQNNITDWTIANNDPQNQESVDYIGSYWLAQDGTRSVDLAGNYPSTISQILTTVAGQAYDLSFWVSRNPDGGLTPRTGVLDVDGVQTIFTYVNPASSSSNMLWQMETFSFVATGTSTLLAFAAQAATSGCCYGPALDNVSVTATPEPATWLMLILGFGLAGSAVRSARRRKLGMVA